MCWQRNGTKKPASSPKTIQLKTKAQVARRKTASEEHLQIQKEDFTAPKISKHGESSMGTAEPLEVGPAGGWSTLVKVKIKHRVY